MKGGLFMGLFGCGEDNTLLILVLILCLCGGNDILGSFGCGDDKGLSGILPIILLFFLLGK